MYVDPGGMEPEGIRERRVRAVDDGGVNAQSAMTLNEDVLEFATKAAVNVGMRTLLAVATLGTPRDVGEKGSYVREQGEAQRNAVARTEASLTFRDVPLEAEIAVDVILIAPAAVEAVASIASAIRRIPTLGSLGALDDAARVTSTESRLAIAEAAGAGGESKLAVASSTEARLASAESRAVSGADEAGFSVGYGTPGTRSGGGQVVTGYIGAIREKALGIIDSGHATPRGGRVFVGGTADSTLAHGADLSLRMNFSLEVRMQIPESSTVIRKATMGVDRTTLILGDSPIPTDVSRLHVRQNLGTKDEPEIVRTVVEGVDRIREFLTGLR